MNRKYIDFVPNNSVRSMGSSAQGSAQVIMPKPVELVQKKPEKIEKDEKALKDAKVAKAKKISAKPSSVMGDGMIRSAMKRTFRSKKVVSKKPTEIKEPNKEVKEEKILMDALTRADNLGQTLRVPQTRFVNTDKIVKRPLSKNVYQKKIIEPKEEIPQGPVTIIQKPEKDSKVGLVVTIIITIILGAAAGTVAFLLLPK